MAATGHEGTGGLGVGLSTGMGIRCPGLRRTVSGVGQARRRFTTGGAGRLRSPERPLYGPLGRQQAEGLIALFNRQ